MEAVRYKVVWLPPARSMTAGARFELDGDAWEEAAHIWKTPNFALFKTFFMLSFPDFLCEGSAWFQDVNEARMHSQEERIRSGRTGVLVFSAEMDQKFLSTDDQVACFFRQNYPDIVDGFTELDAERRVEPGVSFDEFCAETAARPWIANVRNLFCSRLAVGNVVLLGDPAQAMAPSIGQGAACGLEYAYVLAETLKANKFQVYDALSDYSASRLADAHGCVELSQRIALYKPFSFYEFVSAVLFRTLLQKALPFLITPCNVFDDCQTPSVSYGSVSAKVNLAIWVQRVVLILLSAFFLHKLLPL